MSVSITKSERFFSDIGNTFDKNSESTNNHPVLSAPAKTNFVCCRDCKNHIATDREKFCRCEVSPYHTTARYMSKDNPRSCKYFAPAEMV